MENGKFRLRLLQAKKICYTKAERLYGMKDTKIQWHPGFVAAMNLELSQNRDDLIFEKEHNLNTKPLEIDLLIIRKDSSVHIANEIGSFFRGHNIIEYKSPEDHLDIDVFYKVGAYASLYKSYGKILDERKADDITVSIVRERKPEGLFKYFKEHGYCVSNPEEGIYYVEGKILFPTQIIVTKELDIEKHTWLRVLSGNVEEKDVVRLLDRIKALTEKDDKDMADSVLWVMMEANQQIVEEWKGDADMFDALMEIVEPQVKLREEKVRKEGIQGTVDVLKELGHGESEIKTVIIKKYGLSTDEAAEYL